jgi:hypothetical protein
LVRACEGGSCAHRAALAFDLTHSPFPAPTSA